MKPVIGIIVCGWILALVAPFVPTFAVAGEIEPNWQIISVAPGLSLHKEMFMLPMTYSEAYDGEQIEAVFQISAKHRLFNTRLYFAYKQISFWQAYDHNNSAPFRETNYNPELFYRMKCRPLSSGYFGADFGAEHESNGQKPPVSRSWNLLYVSPYFFRDNILIHLKFRYRIPEDEKPYPEAMVGDDNPDITDYLGYNDLNVYYKFWRGHLIHLMARGNISTGRGGMALSYSLPVTGSQRSYLTFRLMQGHGESLVDYKRSLTRVGVGIMFMS